MIASPARLTEEMVKPSTTGSRNHAAWVGPLISIAGLLSYFSIMVRFPDLRDSAVVNLIMVVLGAATAVWGLMKRRNWKSWLGVVGALVPAILLFGYVYGLSSQIPPPGPEASVGTQAPPLELPDQNGRVVSLADYAGRRVLVVFYRGYW
jgi:hypothetical protein